MERPHDRTRRHARHLGGHPPQPDGPFAYATSPWLREVRRQTGLTVHRPFFSLEAINQADGKKHGTARRRRTAPGSLRPYLAGRDRVSVDRARVIEFPDATSGTQVRTQEGGNGMTDEDDVPKEQVVTTLAGEWAALADLLGALSPEQWALPTCLPGWRVTDVVAHLIGTEAMLSGEQTPVTDVDVKALPHVRNDIGAVNEQWVLALRDEPPAALLERFCDVTARRAAALETMSYEEFDSPSWTPAGKGTYGRFMQIRIYDCWLHEQDIRDAVGLPGNQDGPAAEAALGEVSRALGYVVGKRAQAPEGSLVLFDLTGPLRRRLAVAVDGRARLVPDRDVRPTVTLRMPAPAFVRRCGGRATASGYPDVVLEGDAELARRVLDNLNFTI